MEDAILSLENQAMERWRNGDPGGFVELSAGDITYVDPGLASPIIGLENYRSYMQQVQGKIHYQGSEFIQPKVVTLGDAAVLSYNYRSSELSPDGKILNQTPWNATEVYFRRYGQWKIVHTHWSFIHHKLPESLEIPIPVQMSQQEYPGLLGEIMALESAAMERWRKGDPGGFIELYTPETTYFDTGTPQRLGGAALRAEMAQRQGQIYYDVMEFIAPGIQVQGNMAVLFYRFFSTRLNPDGSIASRIPWNCSEVYVRSDGQWRILHNHWSYIKGEQV
jgi:ketosteroid isomerase-like protein